MARSRKQEQERKRKWESFMNLLMLYLKTEEKKDRMSIAEGLVSVAERTLHKDVREETNFAKTAIRVVKAQLSNGVNAEACKTLMAMVKREGLQRRLDAARAHARLHMKRTDYQKSLEKIIESALREGLAKMGA